MSVMQPTDATAADSGVEIDIQQVQKIYETRAGEEVRALECIDQHIAPGEFVSIVGPSGCGKSTLLAILAGLLEQDHGTVRINSQLVTRSHPRMAVVFQRDLLLKWRTVEDNILLPVEVKGWKISEYRPRARDLMKQVGLIDFARKYPDELSGGMRQRVAICRALVQQPGLLLMDEPFGALDALTREQMTIDLQRLWRRINNTVVFVTHSIDEAIFLSDRVLVMSPRPGKIDLDLKIDIPRPRRLAGRTSPQFLSYLESIRSTFERQGVLVEEDVS
ncbi:MAG TPA: ABC transporter ATP-binding protein [Pseudolabrys sp.]|nr:ABC transporter ATP-binding protein [Pseudolabrys sp.]